jgi:hypothetical protein
VDTAASIAELVLDRDPADFLDGQAARISAELDEEGPTLQ